MNDKITYLLQISKPGRGVENIVVESRLSVKEIARSYMSVDTTQVDVYILAARYAVVRDLMEMNPS